MAPRRRQDRSGDERQHIAVAVVVKEIRIEAVEDEDFLRIITQTMLEELGYTVLTASDGREGVAVFQACHGDLDLVILDMVMPVLGGRQAFELMRDLDPTVPVLLASGLSKDEALFELKQAGLRGFIRKPCGMAELSRLVAAALAGR